MTIIYILLAAVVLVAVIIYLLSATLHIAKIIKELEAISKNHPQWPCDHIPEKHHEHFLETAID